MFLLIQKLKNALNMPGEKKIIVFQSRKLTQNSMLVRASKIISCKLEDGLQTLLEVIVHGYLKKIDKLCV